MFIEAKNLTQAFSNTIRRKSYQIQEERQKKKKKIIDLNIHNEITFTKYITTMEMQCT